MLESHPSYLLRRKVINGLELVVGATVDTADLGVAIIYLGLKGVLGDVKGLLLRGATSLAYRDNIVGRGQLATLLSEELGDHSTASARLDDLNGPDIVALPEERPLAGGRGSSQSLARVGTLGARSSQCGETALRGAGTAGTA